MIDFVSESGSNVFVFVWFFLFIKLNEITIIIHHYGLCICDVYSWFDVWLAFNFKWHFDVSFRYTFSINYMCQSVNHSQFIFSCCCCWFLVLLCRWYNSLKLYLIVLSLVTLNFYKFTIFININFAFALN